MKNLLFLLPLVLFSNTALAEKVTIWPKILLSKTVDIDQIDQILSTSRDEVRSRLITDVERIIQYNQPAEVAAAIVMSFDRYYDNQRTQSMSGLDKHFESLIMSSLDGGHRFYNIENRKLYFMSKSRASYLLSTIQRGISTDADSYDLVLYGTYATLGTNRRGQALFEITLNAFNQRTGIINTYTASGEINQIAEKLITQLFDTYYATSEFPIDIPNENIQIVHHEKNSFLGRRAAEKKCQKLNSRLPSRDEIETVELIGPYNGTLNLKRPALYYLVEDKMDNTYGENYQLDRMGLGNHFLSAKDQNELRKLIQNNVYKLAHQVPKSFFCVK